MQEKNIKINNFKIYNRELFGNKIVLKELQKIN